MRCEVENTGIPGQRMRPELQLFLSHFGIHGRLPSGDLWELNSERSQLFTSQQRGEVSRDHLRRVAVHTDVMNNEQHTACIWVMEHHHANRWFGVQIEWGSDLVECHPCRIFVLGHVPNSGPEVFVHHLSRTSRRRWVAGSQRRVATNQGLDGGHDGGVVGLRRHRNIDRNGVERRSGEHLVDVPESTLVGRQRDIALIGE